MRGLNPGTAPAFPLSRWHESYNRAEVDAFVQRLRDLPAGELSANQIREHRFPPARWAHVGYDVTAVDAYLESVADSVAAGRRPDAVSVPGPETELPEDTVVSWDLPPLVQLVLVLAVVVLLVLLTG